MFWFLFAMLTEYMGHRTTWYHSQKKDSEVLGVPQLFTLQHRAGYIDVHLYTIFYTLPYGLTHNNTL